jgi:hypothetical protein
VQHQCEQTARSGKQQPKAYDEQAIAPRTICLELDEPQLDARESQLAIVV